MRITNTALFEHNNYSIIAQSYETSTGWGHIAILKHNDRPLDTLQTARIRYYNRTWERYQYQSAILDVISQQIEAVKDLLCWTHKAHTGKSRLTKQEKEELYANDSEIAELKELKHYFADEYRGY